VFLYLSHLSCTSGRSARRTRFTILKALSAQGRRGLSWYHLDTRHRHALLRSTAQCRLQRAL